MNLVSMQVHSLRKTIDLALMIYNGIYLLKSAGVVDRC